MDGIIASAKYSFRHPFVTFQDELNPGHPSLGNQPYFTTDWETTEIREGAPIKQERRNAQKLSSFYDESDPDDGTPHLKLVRIHSHLLAERPRYAEDFVMDVSRELFQDIFHRMEANPWLLWLISNKYDGYHYLTAQRGYAHSFFFGFFNCAVIWTYSPARACTKALLITRRSFYAESYYQLLHSYAPHLTTPYAPLMAFATELMLSYDKRLDRYLKNIVHVEERTGFSGTDRKATDFSFDVDALAKLSRVSANAQINIINAMRHHENCMQALHTIKDVHATGVFKQLDARYRDAFDKSIGEMLDTIQILDMRGETFRSYAMYLKNRAEAQISVVFALLTHEDSISNLKAAEASKEIAAAAKRDSSAMKTIAFMTMAFLPATFLAALFAVPVLEWERKTNVRMDELQLYWIVAILSTAFIFAVWALVTKWGWVLRKGSKRLKNRQEGSDNVASDSDKQNAAWGSQRGSGSAL